MSDVHDDLEKRLREHLARADGVEPDPGFEARLLRVPDQPPVSWYAAFGVVAAAVIAITLLVLLTVGHQTNQVFSNINSGLGS